MELAQGTFLSDDGYFVYDGKTVVNGSTYPYQSKPRVSYSTEGSEVIDIMDREKIEVGYSEDSRYANMYWRG